MSGEVIIIAIAFGALGGLIGGALVGLIRGLSAELPTPEPLFSSKTTTWTSPEVPKPPTQDGAA